MNLIERLFGKKGNAFESITYERIPDWLESRSQNVSGKIEKAVSSIYPDIEKALRKIRDSTTELEKANPEGRFHLKMVKVASSNRDNMARQVRMLLENIAIPEDMSVKSIKDFHESAAQNMKVCLENMMKSYQYTKLVFFDESKNVISDVNSLGRLLNDMIEPVNSKKQVLDAIDRAQKLTGDLRKTSQDIEEIERSLIENEKKLHSLEKEIEEKRKALDLLHAGSSWNQSIVLKDSLVSLEKDAERKLSEINSLISPLNKVFHRLKQLSDSGRHTLKPGDRDALNLCLSSPVDVPPGFFIELENIVKSDALNLPKTDKIISQIRLAASTIGEKRSIYRSMIREIGQKKEEISKMKIIAEEKELNGLLSSLYERVKSLEKEIGVSTKQLESMKLEIGSIKNELQENVSLIDARMRIT